MKFLSPSSRHRLSAVVLCLVVLAGAVPHCALGWGSTVHQIINRNAVIHLPPEMAVLAAQQSYLASHASDADYRKSSDTAEGPKHYLDIDWYPDFATLTPSLTALVGQYGWATVKENGILPWATVWAMDSLTAQAKRGDWTKAYQTAADVGHYVGDVFQPLHCTQNYDGVMTGNNGIHSRYESSMISTYKSALVVSKGPLQQVTDPYRYIFTYILRSQMLVDSILHADTRAKLVSGGSYSSTYYASLWASTDTMTIQLVQDATVVLASLWQYAWQQAGLLAPTSVEAPSLMPLEMTLMANYPNPFNGTTTIPFSIRRTGHVTLTVHSLLGQETGVLYDDVAEGGEVVRVRFHADRLASGVYLARIPSGEGRRREVRLRLYGQECRTEMTSPSLTMYSFPSSRHTPASFVLANDPPAATTSS
jgi:hypothetical protein